MTDDAHDGEGTVQLGPFLAGARRDAGLRQVEVVSQTALSQAQLSRIERGQAVPTVDQARALASLYKLVPAVRTRVVQAAKDHEADRVDSRIVIQRGNILSLQQRFRRLEEQASVLRAFSPTMVPGHVQTAAYIAAVFDQPEDADVVRDRLRRAVEDPGNAGRLYTLILAEGAVRWPLGSPSLMADQLDHLVRVSELPHVRLGFIGWRETMDIGPGPGFYLYDDHTVVLSGVGGYALLNAPADVADYRATFHHLEQLTVFGDDARARLREIAGNYRYASRDSDKADLSAGPLTERA
jgi:transcriptional regulator with XRE-family HTH domain